MVADIMALYGTAFSQVVSWFERILRATGMTGIFLAGFFLFLLFKFIISPVFGSAGSDQVKRKKE